MGLIRLFLWLALFAAATFFWVVLLQHGTDGFSEGVKKEWRALRDGLSQ